MNKNQEEQILAAACACMCPGGLRQCEPEADRPRGQVWQ